MFTTVVAQEVSTITSGFI